VEALRDLADQMEKEKWPTPELEPGQAARCASNSSKCGSRRQWRAESCLLLWDVLKYPRAHFTHRGLNMNDPLNPEPEPDDLTQTTEPESIQLTEKEAENISAGSLLDHFIKY
jgi:hypothetical protein